MIESTSPTNVRDLTTAARHIPIEDDGAAVFDVILALWSTFNPKEDRASFELGVEWFEAVEKRTPSELAKELRTLGGPHCGAWLCVAGLAATSPHPHDPDRVLDWLAKIDPQRLRRWIIGYLNHFKDGALIEAAAEGDRNALETIMDDRLTDEEKGQAVELLEIDSTDLRDRMIRSLARFRTEVFASEESQFAGAVSRAAASRRATATRDDAKTVIEDVTNGLDFEVPLGVTRVILVPSVVLKPLSLIDQFRDALLVFYAVADEFIDSDPEAPPSWMVRTYKALSDERRLRILRRLSESETTLDELTELLGLSKSTVHHHISVLRAAGLVRVHLSKDKDSKHESKSYALREQPLADAGHFLDSYVRTGARDLPVPTEGES